MLIILEGVDCTFKSTLASELSKRLDLPIQHGSSFESAKKPNAELYKWYLNKLITPKNKILDRFIYSNLVYSSVYQGYTSLTEQQFRDIENLILNLHDVARIIYCYGYLTDICERMRLRGEDKVKEKDIDILFRAYENILGRTRIRTLLYNSSLCSPVDFINNMIKDGELINLL